MSKTRFYKAGATLTSRLKRFPRACSESGVPYNTMRDAVLRGDLPVVKIGKAWFLEQTDVDDFINARKTRYTA